MRCERHGLTPVIINDLDIVRIALPEAETDTPARVHRKRDLGKILDRIETLTNPQAASGG